MRWDFETADYKDGTKCITPVSQRAHEYVRNYETPEESGYIASFYSHFGQLKTRDYRPAVELLERAGLTVFPVRLDEA